LALSIFTTLEYLSGQAFKVRCRQRSDQQVARSI
jgi:hypothetical protein